MVWDDHVWQSKGSRHGRTYVVVVSCTLWKTNMEPQTRGLEDDLPFPRGDFELPC